MASDPVEWARDRLDEGMSEDAVVNRLTAGGYNRSVAQNIVKDAAGNHVPDLTHIFSSRRVIIGLVLAAIAAVGVLFGPKMLDMVSGAVPETTDEPTRDVLAGQCRADGSMTVEINLPKSDEYVLSVNGDGELVDIRGGETETVTIDADKTRSGDNTLRLSRNGIAVSETVVCP